MKMNENRLEELRQIERVAQTNFAFQKADPATVRCNARPVYCHGELESKTGAGSGFQKGEEFVTGRPFEKEETVKIYTLIVEFFSGGKMEYQTNEFEIKTSDDGRISVILDDNYLFMCEDVTIVKNPRTEDRPIRDEDRLHCPVCKLEYDVHSAAEGGSCPVCNYEVIADAIPNLHERF